MSIIAYIKHLAERFRYESGSQILLDTLDRLGVSIHPFYLFEESLPSGGPPPVVPGFGNVEIRPLGARDMAAVAAVPWRGLDEDFFLQRLERGNGCLGLFDRGRLAAFTWYDRRACDYDGWRFPLCDGEAYLFDSFTLTPWRGKGLAPYLRYRVYEVLADRGCTRFYSVSVRTNRSALRFKQKLGGRVVGKGWLVKVFRRWQFGSRPPGRRP